MREQRADVDVVMVLADSGKKLRECLPTPVERLAHNRPRDVLDTLHQFYEFLAMLGLAGREADSAIAHHHRRDTVPGRRDEPAVPHRLGIVVSVDIDESRRHDAAPGVDLLRAPLRHLSDRDDAAVLDGDVPVAWGVPRAVDDRAVSYNEIESAGHVASPSVSFCPEQLGATALRVKPLG